MKEKVCQGSQYPVIFIAIFKTWVQECQQRLIRHEPELRAKKSTNLSLFTGWDVFSAGLDVSPYYPSRGEYKIVVFQIRTTPLTTMMQLGIS